MFDLLNSSIFVSSGLIVMLLILKVIVLNSGKKIRTSFSSFFWYSKIQIENSSYHFSRRKRVIMNQLSMIILFILGMEALIFIAFLWSEK
jgi:hypothetical protein